MKILLMIFLTVISINSFGQFHLIGVQGGVNLTNLTTDIPFEDSKYRIGIISGINYEFMFQGKYTLSADILYNQQGFIIKTNYTDENGNLTGKSTEDKFDYDYLSLPLKIGYTLGNKIKVFTKIGVCPSVLLKAETKISKVDISGNLINYETFDVKDKVSKFDLGGLIEFGAGYGLNNNLELFSSFICRKSLTTFSNADYFKDSKMRHYGFSLTIGLKYKLSKK
jgi:opacity protein-like surface antigen